MNTRPGQVPAAKTPAPIPPDNGSALTALLVVVSITGVLAMLLGDREGFSALRDWNSGLLAAVSLLALAAMIVGLVLFFADGAPVLGIAERLLVTVGTTILVWAALGYSLTYTRETDFIGGFSKVFLSSVTIDSRVATFTAGFTISEIGFVIFQGCVAAIASALAIGPLGKRMTPAAVALFVPLWAILVFFPIAHMAWYWVGPDAIADAAKALAAAGDSAAKAAAQATLDDVITDAGWLFKKGLLDYAGGTVVALAAGTAGLVGLVLRADASNDPGKGVAPDRWQAISNRGALGLALMWLAWFGIIAASNLDFGDSATKVAMASCFSATGAAAVAGAVAEWLMRGQASVRGVLYGTLAGIVAVSPAAAFSGPVGAVALGLTAGAAAIALMHASGLGAPADLPIVHACGGLIGTLGTGILVNPALGGMGIMDYTTGKIADYDFATQMTAQSWGIAVTLVWAGLGSLILFWIIGLMIGRRPENRRAS